MGPNASWNHELGSRVLRLPISPLGKVELWLTYRQLKPVSSITLNSDSTNSLQDPKTKEIIKWISDAGLQFFPDPKVERILHVSRSLRLAKVAARIARSNTYEDTLTKGKIFGYPVKAGEVFAVQFPLIAEKKPIPGGIKFVVQVKDRELLSHYWWPYARYSVRRGYVYEDSLVAKKWADVVRREVPKLAKFYEESMEKLKD